MNTFNRILLYVVIVLSIIAVFKVLDSTAPPEVPESTLHSLIHQGNDE